MKLTLLPADKGDCLLITGADGRTVLVDGGMARSYRDFVAPTFGRMREAGHRLDLVIISHIDQDHISGVLAMLDDEVAWRVHQYQRDGGNDRHPQPSTPRPPEVGGIWHNAFHELVGDNAGPIADTLSATATAVFGHEEEGFQSQAVEAQDLATGVRDAIRVSRRVRGEQLGIPLNEHFGGRLARVLEDEDPTPIQVGGMALAVLAPFETDLVELREEWNKWLERSGEALKAIQQRARDDQDRLRHATAVGDVLDPMVGQAIALGGVLGDRSRVTAENLASVMVLVEEGEASILLTGDGHANEVLRGLDYFGKLNGSGGLHVTVLKVPHHGSEYNTTAEFCRRVTGDHYVFCANGAHMNPDPRIVEMVIDSRLGGAGVRSTNSEVENDFTLWFNGSSVTTERTNERSHMLGIEQLVKNRAAASGGRLHSVFRADQNPKAPGLEVSF